MPNKVSFTDFQAALLKRLQAIVGANVPIGHDFFRDADKYPNGFLRYEIRNFTQAPFVGDGSNDNVTIAKPIVQVDVFAKDISNTYILFEQIRASLHAYTGLLDNSVGQTTNIKVAICDVQMLDEDYLDGQRFYVVSLDLYFELNS